MSKEKKYFINPSSDKLLLSNLEPKETRIKDKTIYLTPKGMSKLFDVGVPAINKHLKYIFDSKELDKNLAISIMKTTTSNKKSYKTQFYNLDTIISVSYKVSSKQAIKFRQWATSVLKEYTLKRYLLDKERLINGQIFGKDFFEKLLEDIQEIRVSKRNFYQKITDIYITSYDYDKNSQTTKNFFTKVQNKLYYRIHNQTAESKVLKSNTIVTKNELKLLDRTVSMYLDFAEFKVRKQEPMSMKAWAEKLNDFLEFKDLKVLINNGSVFKEQAQEFTKEEFKKFRILQNKLFSSDFDKTIKDLSKLNNKNKIKIKQK